MAVIVDPSGKTIQATVISGAEPLREYYLNAIRQWTYKPFLVDGKPVFIQTTVTLICDYGAID